MMRNRRPGESMPTLLNKSIAMTPAVEVCVGDGSHAASMVLTEKDGYSVQENRRAGGCCLMKKRQKKLAPIRGSYWTWKKVVMMNCCLLVMLVVGVIGLLVAKKGFSKLVLSDDNDLSATSELLADSMEIFPSLKDYDIPTLNVDWNYVKKLFVDEPTEEDVVPEEASYLENEVSESWSDTEPEVTLHEDPDMVEPAEIESSTEEKETDSASSSFTFDLSAVLLSEASLEASEDTVRSEEVREEEELVATNAETVDSLEENLMRLQASLEKMNNVPGSSENEQEESSVVEETRDRSVSNTVHEADPQIAVRAQTEEEAVQEDLSDLVVNESFALPELAQLNGHYDGRLVKLSPQIQLPKKPLYQNVNVGKNFWPVMQELRRLGWASAPVGHPSKVSFFFSRGKVPSFLMRRYRDPEVNAEYNNKMINSIGYSGCIGGQKGLQLQCRKKLAALHGCDYDDLRIQPAQFVITDKATCDAFFEKYLQIAKSSNTQWLYKPKNTYHGAGIKLFSGMSGLKALHRKYNYCDQSSSKYNRYNNGVIMEYVDNPATIKTGYKFDFRTYVLIASLNPKLVFYHDGFARKADVKLTENENSKKASRKSHAKSRNAYITNSVGQTLKDHFFNFSSIDKLLVNEPRSRFDPGFFQTKQQYLMQVSRFMFETVQVQDNELNKKNGRFHLFGVDWMVDEHQRIHLLEGNGYPLVGHYPDIGLTPKIWKEMTALLLHIHTTPEKLDPRMTVKESYAYGGWKLIYNELEEVHEETKGNGYNACAVFPAQ